MVWRAELDKGHTTWESPLPVAAVEALAAQRAAVDKGTRFVFPSTTRRDKPVARHLAAYWLLRAYRQAGVEKQRGSLWHSFRRKWATQRKHYPIVDVAAAGEWKDLTTLLTCYQQPDPDTMRAVIDLALRPHNSRRTERTSDPERPGDQPAARALAGAGEDAEEGQAAQFAPSEEGRGVSPSGERAPRVR